jgi:acetyltransferase-like isoleucine patch superfamily enzyme
MTRADRIGLATPEMRQMTNKRFLRSALGAAPVAAFSRLVMLIGRTCGRLASFVRARALFPQSEDVVCHWSAEVKYPANIMLGKRVVIGPECTIGASAEVFIGDDVLFSKGVFVDTGTADISTPLPYAKMSKPIHIGHGVWLGARAMVMAGVKIGDNSIIAAGTIVRKNVPAGSFVVGEKARVQSFTTL